jgi:Na+/H+ antiporter NhaC
MKVPPRGQLVRWAISASILLGLVAAIPALSPLAREGTLSRAIDRAVTELEERLPSERPDLSLPVGVRLHAEDENAVPAIALVRERIRRSAVLREAAVSKPLRVLLDDGGTTLRIGVAFDEHSAQPIEIDRSEARVHPLAIAPPVVAIVFAFATGKLVLSLGLAVVLGGLLAAGFHPFFSATRVVVDYGWRATFTDASKLWIFVFTTCLIGLVGLITRAGGIQAIVDRLARVAKGPRSAQFATFFLGWAVFFDDYANTILVGGTMRPLSDRMRISREKLSYLVDSTSAPIAGVAVISTWIGYEVGLLGDAARSLGLGMDGYEVFFRSLPFRFYCYFTLAFVFFLIWTGRDFGPMLRAERRAARTSEVLGPDAVPLSSGSTDAALVKDGVQRSVWVAALPIGIVLFGTLFGLLWDGGGLAAVVASPGALFSFTTWRQAFGAADSTQVLGLATLTGAAAAFALVLGRKLLTPREAVSAFWTAARTMGVALVILTLAWALKAACDDLGTSELLVAGLRDVLDPRLLPLIVFLLAGVVAFSTGTSWGTMGILIPTAAPLAYHLAGPEGMFLTLAAVLDGAIFGDHVSPISDTTVMSSIATGSDHLDHVRTQLPYATVTMGVALIFGYAWNGMGGAYALSWLLGVATMVAIILLVGRRSRTPELLALLEQEPSAPGEPVEAHLAGDA